MTDVQAGYRGDLAHVQDAGFGDFARGAAPGLLLALADEGIRDGVVVDLGCGSGIWAEIPLAAGHDVHGIELSADLLEIARRRAPGARFEEGAWRRSDEVHALHLHDPDELTAALVRVGFKAQVLGGWGRRRLARGHIAVHARRPA